MTVPKTVHFLKSIDGTDNGTKKVPRNRTAVLLFRGTAQLWPLRAKEEAKASEQEEVKAPAIHWFYFELVFEVVSEIRKNNSSHRK